MSRIACFVDGFNVFHALKDKEEYHKYKWLNLAKLTQCFVRPADQVIEILYFTALAHWNPDKVNRHKTYIAALKSVGIKIVPGEFKRREKLCRNCNRKYWTHEEKRTDVNIAIKLFEGAIKDSYDTALIISGDSDLVPAIEAVKTMFPAKHIHVVIPIGRRAEILKQTADSYMKMKQKHLKSSQFEDTVNIEGGNSVTRPPRWV